MDNRSMNLYKRILVVFIVSLCVGCGTSDEGNDWNNCEVFMRPNSGYQLKIINNSSSYIYVSLNQYKVSSVVPPGICETFGLDIGYKTIEISLCDDDICDDYSFTHRETRLFEDGVLREIEITDSYFTDK